MTFQPLTRPELNQLREELLRNGESGAPVLVRRDTTAAAVAGAPRGMRSAVARLGSRIAAFLGRAVPEVDLGVEAPSDDEVASAVASVPCHY